LGKYYLGVKPTSPGYEAYVIEPSLGGLQWMEGKVPTPKGDINVYCSNKEIKVRGVDGTGTLRFTSKRKPSSTHGNIQSKGNDVYEVIIEKGKEYIVNYEL
jgi:hypothetical protein